MVSVPERPAAVARPMEFMEGTVAAWRDPASATTPFGAGVDTLGARDDIERDCDTSIDTVDGQVSGPLALDGEPGGSP